MARTPQSEANRGSQKWLQRLVNHYPLLLEEALRPKLNLPQEAAFEWLSPLRHDEYAEYSDQTFIDRLRVDLIHSPLGTFWPNGGPVWDGLGRTKRGDLILVEAKSHIGEVISTPTRARGVSLDRIIASLEQTKTFLRANMTIDWSRYFYQFTNRLAHLYLLRQKNHLSAFLVMIYFVGDQEMNGPMTPDEWRGAILLLKKFLRVNNAWTNAHILDVMIDVQQLPPPPGAR